ncbi:MAG: YhcB family protein [Pseudomonadales bacterium]|nr:YhcB family protein [Pseudomonadales bacterium]
MDISAVFIAAVIGFGIGAVFGGLVFGRFSSDQNKTRELEKHLHDKQDEIKHYQQEVRQHFVETAGLLRGLAENYRDVHNHLAMGAEKLSPDSSSGPLIKKLPEVDAIEVNELPDNLQAPLDYAPKTSPFDKSVLDESYDLKTNSEEPDRTPNASETASMSTVDISR